MRNKSAESTIKTSLDGRSDADSQQMILDTILDLLDVSKADFSPILPFTSFGLDSLGATRISTALRPYVSISQMQLLGGMTWEQIQERMEDDRITQAPVPRSGVDEMKKMVTKYTQDFGEHKGSSPMPAQEVVWLSGTTGSLGSHALAELVASPKVAKIYAFNRKASSQSLIGRQRKALQDRGLDPDLADSPKVVLVEGDLAEMDFGLTDPKMLQQVSTVLADARDLLLNYT